jgi:uncharacterized protein
MNNLDHINGTLNGHLNGTPIYVVCEQFAWDELAVLWDVGDFSGVHDWLGLRWNHLIQTRPGGHNDPDARFLQGLAFAALSFHFTQNQKQDGAALLADDAMGVLTSFRPAHRGVEVAPILETLSILRPFLNDLAPEDDCPMQPFIFKRFVYRKGEV